MASRPSNSTNAAPDPRAEFPDLDQSFREMRDKMNRNREAFFNDSPEPFFGRESPFMRQTRPGFDEFRSQPSSFSSMGFPPGPASGAAEKMESKRRPTPPSSKDESIPIRVIHEKQQPEFHPKHKSQARATTADLPHHGESSPRVTRAHSEPPKTFNQRLMKTKIPLGNVSEQNENNLSTSASDSSVPHTESPEKPQRKQKTSCDNTSANEPAVRHIPIRVEGRDEPVLNPDFANSTKKPSDFYPSGVKVERRAQNPPSSLKVNSSNSDKNLHPGNSGEPTSPLSPIPSDQPIPMGYTEPDNAKPAASEEPQSPQPLPAGPIPLPCSSTYLNNSSSKSAPAGPSQAQPQPPGEPEIKQKKMPNPDDPCMQKLAKIMENVLDLEKELNAFKGDKNSKEYRYLDEMLTRNLLALDGIETAGREDIRQHRKESIKSINRCLSLLESKAKGSNNQAEKNNEILSDLAAKSQAK